MAVPVRFECAPIHFYAEVTSMRPFSPFEVALESFFSGGGARVIAIRSPLVLMEAFREATSQESLEALRYMDDAVELAPAQQHVSVRDISITGQAVEIPTAI